MEPNRRPPPISAIIMIPQSQMTAQVLRSRFSWPGARKTCECGEDDLDEVVPVMVDSLKIGANDIEQLLGGIGSEIRGCLTA
jgi:hypothetical protein